jgi:hypothetical protein
MNLRRSCLLTLLGLAWAGINALKPLQIDDAAYFYYARQFASHPLDPYFFSIYWYEQPEPANGVLAPPVFPATWGAVMHLGPAAPWAWKLLLAPWAILFVFSLDALARRFAPGAATPVVLLTVACPAFLPALNLMLDVPVLALSLAAITVFLSACDRGSWGLAVSAGLLAGLAMQTKYTAFVVPAALVVASGLWRRPNLGLVAALTAVQVFLTWELLMAILYGDSHFLLARRGQDAASDKKLERYAYLFAGVIGQAGGLLPALWLYALAALRARRVIVIIAASAVVAAYGTIFLQGWYQWSDEPLQELVKACAKLAGLEKWYHGGAGADGRFLTFLMFSVLGVGLFATMVVVLIALWMDRSSKGDLRGTAFLVLWLLLEVLVYFAASPFPAARRMLGLAVVLVLLIGRLHSKSVAYSDAQVNGPTHLEGIVEAPSPAAGSTSEPRWSVPAIVAGGALLGLLYSLVDHLEASAQLSMVRQSAAWVRDQGGGRMWSLGHWGFQFNAERAGMEALMGDYAPTEPPAPPLPQPSRPRAGDWIIIPNRYRVHCPQLYVEPPYTNDPVELAVTFTWDDHVPLRTIWCYYLGVVPIEGHSEPRMYVRIYRVQAAFEPHRNP